MHVLLVYSNRSRDLTTAPPIGLAYVATATADAGHRVVIVDLMLDGDGETTLRRALRKHRPDVVGLSVRNIDSAAKQRPAWQIDEVARQVATVRETLNAKIVVGGPAVSVLGSAALEHLPADFAVVGEGETAFPALLRALERGDSVDGIPGVYARNGQGIAGRRPERLPGFGRSGMERWVDWSGYRRRGGTWAIQTKRGCPMRCVYCAYPGIEGTHVRRRTAEEVVDEIEHVAQTIRPQTFEFVDSTFNVPTSHALEICDELVRRDLGVRLTTMGVNPSGVSKDLFSAMRRAGFRSMMISPDAASDTMLASMRKGFTAKDLRRCARLAKASGMKSAWFFLLGGPGETPETIEETLRFVENDLAHPSCLPIMMTGIRILPGTEMEQIAIDERAIAPGHDLTVPTFYFSSRVDEDWVLDRINRALAKNPGIVHAAEEGVSRLERVFQWGLRAARVPPPHWRHLPLLLRVPPLPQLRRRYPPKLVRPAPVRC